MSFYGPKVLLINLVNDATSSKDMELYIQVMSIAMYESQRGGGTPSGEEQKVAPPAAEETKPRGAVSESKP